MKKIMPVIYDQLNIISDSRGVVFEPLISNSFCNQRNAHIVISMPGVVRGNHYHIKGEETIAVMGRALVRIRENDKINDIEVPQGKAYRFTFPVGVSHAIKNLNNQPNLLVAFNTLEHDPKKPDLIMDVLI